MCMYVYERLCLCMHVHELAIYSSTHLAIFLSIYFFLNMTIYMTFCQVISICICVCSSAYLSIYSYIWLRQRKQRLDWYFHGNGERLSASLCIHLYAKEESKEGPTLKMINSEPQFPFSSVGVCWQRLLSPYRLGAQPLEGLRQGYEASTLKIIRGAQLMRGSWKCELGAKFGLPFRPTWHVDPSLPRTCPDPRTS